MSDPYDAPATSSHAVEGHFRDNVSLIVREYRIWHIGIGLVSGLMGLLMVVGGGAVAVVGAGIEEFNGMGAFLGIFYGILGLIYLLPAFFLLRSGWAARSAFPEQEDAILTSLRAQLFLWRIIGSITFFFVGLYALLIGGACLMGALA